MIAKKPNNLFYYVCQEMVMIFKFFEKHNSYLFLNILKPPENIFNSDTSSIWALSSPVCCPHSTQIVRLTLTLSLYSYSQREHLVFRQTNFQIALHHNKLKLFRSHYSETYIVKAIEQLTKILLLKLLNNISISVIEFIITYNILSVYIEAGAGIRNPITLSVVTRGPSYPRMWNIRVSQIPCNSEVKGEFNCYVLGGVISILGGSNWVLNINSRNNMNLREIISFSLEFNNLYFRI